jgi:hypothetical protein
VTVCVAAMSGGTVFGASDRMITAGDIEFEPEQPKIWQMTTGVAAIVSGDIGVHVEIFDPVMDQVRSRIDADPEKWLMVGEIADLLAQTIFRS